MSVAAESECDGEEYMQENTTTDVTERVAHAAEMFWAGSSRKYWNGFESTPRQILLPLTKAELISVFLQPLENVESDDDHERVQKIRARLQKNRKPKLLRVMVASCESHRTNALCDRRGAIEHTRRLRAARAANRRD